MRSILALLCLSICFAAEPMKPLELPGPAKEAVEKYDVATEKISQEAMKAKAKEREKLIKDLQKVLTAQTKKGDFVGAMAIKEKIEALDAEEAKENEGRDLLGNIIAFQIVSAKYGANTTWVDCTNVLTKAVKNGRLDIEVTEPVLSAAVGDPVPGASKQIVIEYIANGVRSKATYNKLDPIHLPKK